MTATLQDILKPGDVLAVRSDGLAGELIRVGEELQGKPGLENHIAVFHHWAGDVPWALEGRPGGVGWVDARAYLGNAYTLDNCLQPGRDGKSRAAVAAEAEHLITTAYDWQAIADDTLRAFHLPDLFGKTVNGTVPGHLVCSSYAAFLYERAGWDRPQVADRDTEPADWCSWIMQHRWSATLVLLRGGAEKKAGTRVVIGGSSTEELIWELQDQVQRVDRKVSRLLSLAGVDPDEAGRLPDDPAPGGAA